MDLPVRIVDDVPLLARLDLLSLRPRRHAVDLAVGGPDLGHEVRAPVVVHDPELGLERDQPQGRLDLADGEPSDGGLPRLRRHLQLGAALPGLAEDLKVVGVAEVGAKEVRRERLHLALLAQAEEERPRRRKGYLR